MKRPRCLRRVLPQGGHDESGFTLAELIVAILIETVIFGALASAFVVVLNGGNSVNQNLARSNDARLAGAYFVSDARNSSSPQLSLTDTTACPDASPPVAGTPTPVVRFTWDAPNAAGTTTPNISNYVLVAGNLMRRHCEPGTFTDQVLASNVAGAPVVSCSTGTDCSGTPVSITIAISETVDAVGNAPYNYSLTAAFRQLNGGGAPLPSTAPPPVIVLGGPCSSGAASVAVGGAETSGTATMRVYGDSFINSTDPSCPGLKLSGNGVYPFQAGSTSFLQGGGTCVTNGPTCPPSTPYSPALTDPYASLVPPSTAGRPKQTGCTGPLSAETAQPGVYDSAFSTGPSGGTCTLATGVYIMQGGLHIGDGITLKSAAGGVLIYVTGDTFSVAGNSNVSLTAPTGGQWPNMVVWLAPNNDANMDLSGSGTVTLNGTVYGPKAQLIVSGTAQVVITAIVVQAIVVTGTGNVIVGAASATPLSITPATLPAWTVNRPYSTALTAAGGDGKYTWAAATGLPAGLSFNTTTAVISGTPTAVGSSPAVTIKLTDALGDDPDTNVYTLVINAVPTVSTASLPAGTVNRPYLAALAATAGTIPYTWVATNLPAGLSVNLLTGAITGTPTAVSAPTVTVTLTDAAGATAVPTYPLTINAVPTISTASLPAGEVSAPYTMTVVGAAGTTPFSWAATNLPAGLTINNLSGVISGTPTAVGVPSVTLTLTDAAGATATKNLTLAITAQPTIVSVTLGNAASGGTAGNVGQGDTITVVFSAQMNVTSFCSTWATDTNNQTLNADSNVTVTLTDATSDTITVTSATCTFNFGSISLGSAAYISGTAAKFSGIGLNKSTIAWTASTRTLVITLGANSSGATPATVASSTPIYTASASIRDTPGGSLGNSPLTLPTGQKF